MPELDNKIPPPPRPFMIKAKKSIIPHYETVARRAPNAMPHKALVDYVNYTICQILYCYIPFQTVILLG